VIKLKSIFVVLSFVGVAVVSILSFIIPSNPYEIIPSLTMMVGDMPLWLKLILAFSTIYLLVLWSIYDKIIQRKERR